MTEGFSRSGRQVLLRAAAATRPAYAALLRRIVSPILRRPNPPRYYDSEDTFWTLQRAYPLRQTYRYDSLSTWQRASQRALSLLRATGLPETRARVLEVGCGDGLTGSMLHGFGHDVTIADIDDWRDRRAREMPFRQADVCTGLDLETSQFDLVYSYNTFEHVTDPRQALSELVRLCKPNGLIYLKFGPLYASAWGLHAYRTMTMPYAQYLFSPRFINSKLQQLGIHDLGRARDELQPLNRWRLHQFTQLWQSAGCSIITSTTKEEFAHLAVIMRFPRAFTGQALTFSDVTTKNIEVVLRKPSLA